VGAALWLIWRLVGPSSLCGIGLFVLLTPMYFIFSRMFGSLRSGAAAQTDERVKLMSEILSGMRVVKMYGWEKPFSAAIAAVRCAELSFVRKTNFLKGVNFSIYFVSTAVGGLLTFGSYFLSGHTLTATEIFSTLAYLRAIQLNAGLHVPYALQSFAEMRVVFRRLEDFLLLPGFPEGSRTIKDSTHKSPAVEVPPHSHLAPANPSVLSLKSAPGVVTESELNSPRTSKGFVVDVDAVPFAGVVLAGPLPGAEVDVDSVVENPVHHSTSKPAAFDEQEEQAFEYMDSMQNKIGNELNALDQLARQRGEHMLTFDGVSCQWDSTEILHDVSFSLARGSLISVIGPVGAGAIFYAYVL
jgi:ABC-type multidrug transport system fused ATPase/permease subunit